MFTLEYAKDPVYASEDGNTITLTVKWEEFNEEMPFGATTFDTHDHGRELHARATAGEFGPIAPYVAPTQPSQPNSIGVQNL
jgi:hypothetical protein